MHSAEQISAGDGASHRIIQIHPTRRCNLSCLHCYSQSGPRARTELPARLIADVLGDARTEGYTVASFSGGEPLMYSPLPALLEHAKALGMDTTVTTNGMLATRQRLDAIAQNTDVLAISLDGKPETHNRIRNHDRAFDVMRARLDDVRASGLRFGFIFTLTQHNLHELPWVAEFAVDQGAGLLQIHPIEEAGRAAFEMTGASPDPRERAWSFLLMANLQAQYGESIRLHLDLCDRATVVEAPGSIYGDEGPADPTQVDLAQILTPLVLEADGSLVPLQHGFPRSWTLGSAKEAGLRDLARRWKRQVAPRFRALCRAVYGDVVARDDLPFFNWFETISAAAHAQPLATTGLTRLACAARR